MREYAPILLFTYKRLDTLKLTVDALKKNLLSTHSDLYIFSDSFRYSEDAETILSVRNYLKTITGFKSITIKYSETNKGLATSIIEGVDYILNIYDRVIVLEDDLITSPLFLTFLNDALEQYKLSSQIFSISAYAYKLTIPINYPFNTFCVPRGCSWGWATWKDRWSTIEWDINKYSEINSTEFKRKFNKMGSDLYPMLIKQKNNKLDSWAIRWYYNQCIQGKLTIYPTYSFVENIGFDNYATHTRGYNRYKTIFFNYPYKDFVFTNKLEINAYFQNQIQNKFSVLTRIFMGRIMSILKKINLLK